MFVKHNCSNLVRIDYIFLTLFQYNDKISHKWGGVMSPFFVHKEIKKAIDNNERITIDELSIRCKERLRHRYLVMSKQRFSCEECGGCPRHWVKGLKWHSWFTLWFYKPPKQTDFTFMYASRDDLEEPVHLTEYLNGKSE